MSTHRPSRASLQTVLDALAAASDLPMRRRQDLRSAVNTVARVIGRLPSEIPVDPQALRARLEGVAPAMHGLSPGRWANIRSLLMAAIDVVRPVLPGRSVAPISPAWTGLLGCLSTHRRIRLQPMLRVFTALGIEPASVRLADLEAYRDALMHDSLRRKPEATWRLLVFDWNACVRSIPGWPQFVVNRPSTRDTYVRPWSDFPPSLAEDAHAYLARLAGETWVDDEDDEGPVRPVRPSTRAKREWELRAFASALVLRGYDPSSLRTLADLVTIEAVRTGLRFFIERKKAKDGGETSSLIFNMACCLKAVARHWVKVDPATLDKIRAIVKRLAVPRGMTAGNREKLRRFDDPKTVEAYLDLPARLRARADTGHPDARRCAVEAQIAVAIAILQMAPVRIQNLVSIEIGRHLKRIGGTLVLVVQEQEVKNREELQFELPQETADIVDWYCTTHRPALLDGPSDALFPGRGGQPKSIGALRQQIEDRVKRHTGLAIHPHLARHIAGKLFLDDRPGGYEVVRQVLGHRSIETTTGFYLGEEKKAANQLYQDTILARRERLRAERANSEMKTSPRRCARKAPEHASTALPSDGRASATAHASLGHASRAPAEDRVGADLQRAAARWRARQKGGGR